MDNGPRRVPPQPQAASRQGQDERHTARANAAPSSEGIMVSPGMAGLIQRLKALLPSSLHGSVVVDSAGHILAGGNRIGVRENNRLLIEYGALFQRVLFPPVMRAMAQAGKMTIFIEITENETCICAGDRLGQKKLHSRLS